VQFSLSHSSTFAASRTSWTCIIESRVEIHTHEGENRARLQFSGGVHSQKQPDLLPDAVLIIVLVVLFELRYGVLNFLDELISRVLHDDSLPLVNADKKKGTSTKGETGGFVVTCKFSDLKISPTASICLMILVMFSFSSSRYACTDLLVDNEASWSLSSFLSACRDRLTNPHYSERIG
jgi:hypothetical protein